MVLLKILKAFSLEMTNTFRSVLDHLKPLLIKRRSSFSSKQILCFLFSCWVTPSNLKHYPVQVLASRTKIYIILEFITGGELFDKIVSHLKLKFNGLTCTILANIIAFNCKKAYLNYEGGNYVGSSWTS